MDTLISSTLSQPLCGVALATLLLASCGGEEPPVEEWSASQVMSAKPLPIAPQPACAFQLTPNNDAVCAKPTCKPGGPCAVAGPCFLCAVPPMPGYGSVVWGDCDVTCLYNPWALPAGATTPCYQYRARSLFDCDSTGCCN